VGQARVGVDTGVEVSCLLAGSGPPVVCLPGWSQAAEQFTGLIDHLAARHRVVAIDHRGHGRSSQPPSGYRVHRLAADLRAVLLALDLEGVTLLGHSMGVAVIWAYLDLYGDDRLARLVLADQRPTLLRDPAWTDAEARVAGGTQTFAELEELCARLRSDDGWPTLEGIMRRMVSPDLAEDRFAALLETNRPTTGATRAALWFDQCTIDWRDLIPTITLPTLVVHGLGSMIPLECQQWTADSIPGARLATIPAEAGGSHFAFWENPEVFAGIVAPFLD
jgi:pimeloyl-ACP methyl ester carboxylesterase